MIEVVISASLLLGAFLMVLAAVGILRFPDLPTRMHASTKSGAMGTSMIMLGVALAFMESVVTFRALAIILFLLITSPVAAHVIGRAGYFVGISLWSGTVKDMLKESYDPETHYLRSGFEGMDDIDDPADDSMENSEDKHQEGPY